MNITEITNSRQLREFMSTPTDGVIECVRKVRGDILILGGSGKMGPELTEMIVRADAIDRYQANNIRCVHVQQPQGENSGVVCGDRGGCVQGRIDRYGIPGRSP